jgi:hypothetical protein
MFLIKFIIFSILFFNTLDFEPKDKSIFIPPVKIPFLLSANFGELRIDHFHSGLDIKTQGVTGKEVVAAASGYIYRISVSPGGFGKALYIRHPSGYSTVYGHLNNFTPEIEKYVKSQQYERKSYLVTLFPLKEKFPVAQGDIIAYSGNSGSSGGPHLHFEIRKSENEIPVNPLLFEFKYKDNIKPVIEKLVVYPANCHTLINKQNQTKRINVSGGDGIYHIADENIISISGLAGFGIKAYDQMNDSFNKCAVHTIELTVDSTTIFRYVMDSFSFSESRFINSHIDYETYVKDKIYVERAFVLPNDKLSTYNDLINRGLFNFNDKKIHHAKIIVTDVNNNKSFLSFEIKPQIEKIDAVAIKTDEKLKVMPYHKSNKFQAENIIVSIPEGALYDTLKFSYKKSTGTHDMLSDLHYVHNKFTPLQKPYTLSIKPIIIPKGKESKMLIIQYDDNKKKDALNSKWTNGYLTADAFSFGKFFVGIDTIPPTISANGLVPGAVLTGKNEIKISISDDISGIKSYEPSIDGEWALFEYDQKNNLLICKLNDQRIQKGIKHNFSLKVIDNKENSNYFNCDFTW